MIIYDITHREIKVSNFVYLGFFCLSKKSSRSATAGAVEIFYEGLADYANEEQPTVRAEKKERRSWRRPFFCVIRISKSGIIDETRSQTNSIHFVFEISLRE